MANIANSDAPGVTRGSADSNLAPLLFPSPPIEDYAEPELPGRRLNSRAEIAEWCAERLRALEALAQSDRQLRFDAEYVERLRNQNRRAA